MADLIYRQQAIDDEQKLINKEQAIDKIKERLFETALNNVGIKQNIDETLIDVAENRLEDWLDELQPVQLGTNLAEVGTNLATKRTVKGFPIDADLLMLIAEEKYGFRARDRLYEIIRYMPKYELSPAQPERKTGRWIYRKELSKYSDMWSCSECNEKTTDSIMGKPRPNFCPLCGADMRGEQDDT